ncbi:MAG: hypothetical protein EOS36_21055 [Mesorhizobium sp.]|uniref:hypothetical protein n=1 Tax=Mesorhizobium sp. TaxID=1871066 RepID=UPI000FE4DBCF|nr:hypothetical protein [Mesorhizobium sp.]RWD60443.1 MAG: hypothetical protein EOS36_21055 [Mesorhizobium sp.]RWE42269.1 MAG: hypothetical protein EOS79_16515 [Mesorhizobium sp.]
MAKGKTQIEKFLEAARAIEDVADEDYDDAVAKVAKAKKLSDDEIKALVKEMRKNPRSKG